MEDYSKYGAAHHPSEGIIIGRIHGDGTLRLEADPSSLPPELLQKLFPALCPECRKQVK